MKVAVVGSGFGGLSVASLLAKNQFDVTVIEKNEQVGGRASVYRENGFTFDMGPSWYLMPDIYERYFLEFNKKPSDLYELVKLNPSYRIFFDRNDIVDVPADSDSAVSLFDSFEPNGGKKLKKYLKSAKEKYNISTKELLYKDYNSIFDLFNPRLLTQATKLRLFENLDTFVNKHFQSEKARRILEYSIGFLGGSPKNTPSFYHIMSHIDLTLGVWYPKGGMRKVVDSIRTIAESFGVKFKLNEPVKKIDVEGKKAKGVITDENKYPADIIIINADYPFSETILLDENQQTYPAKYWKNKVVAPSAFVIYLGVNKKINGLSHHTLFLEKDWEKGFERIFNPAKANFPEKPSYYVNVPSKTDKTSAPTGCEALFILVPLAPGLPDSLETREKFYNQILDHLENFIGESIRESLLVKKIFALEDFTQRYNAYKGTALGISHTLKQTALGRPSHKSKKVSNLYYTGQYNHPGIGVPMTLISSQILTDSILSTYSHGEEL